MPMARVSPTAHRFLREQAKASGKSILEVVDAAVETYRRQVFLAQNAAAFAALRENPKAWQDEQDERGLWDNTLSDGQKRK